MEIKYVLVTNNPKAEEEYRNQRKIKVDYLEGKNFCEVLIRVRDLIHNGYHLLTHPQASNLKPNQCPYKTILVTNGREAEDFYRDVELIESSISGYQKFTKGMRPPMWTEKILLDFQTVDLSVVDSAINRSLLQQMILSNH